MSENTTLIESIVTEFKARLDSEGYDSAYEMYKVRRHEVTSIEDRVFILSKRIEDEHKEWTADLDAFRAAQGAY